jgi:diguanylate cyclase (GGDEF)-like protein
MRTKEILKITKTLHLLYAEDDEGMRNSSADLFQNFFAQITTAEDGLDALEKYQKSSFDIVITDISMPRMDGIELIQNIRMDNPAIPVIVYSAWNNPAAMTACIPLNVDGYLLKPIQTKNVMEVLEKVAHKIAQISKDRFQDQDIKHRIKQESKTLKKQFEFDELTQLKSHNALLDRIDTLQSTRIPVILLINIDEFHVYNKLYGLGVGDEILVRFANKLKAFSEQFPYELYRIGGNEFVLFESVTALDPERHEENIEALFDYLDAAPIVIDGIEEPIRLAITIGISFDHDNSYGRAEMALYEARRRGRRYLGFSAEADRRKELKNNLYWREEIGRALAEHRVHAFDHAIVDAGKNIIKYEALIRIKQFQDDGSIKIVTPDQFLDFSKMSKQYIGLTAVMIEESFRTMLEKNVHIAINLAYQDIENREIKTLLRECITQHNLAEKIKFYISSQVIFELLEHPNHEGYGRFAAFIDEFKAFGVVIAIDNFGLGFSNMSKIASLAPHYVKIDGTLIRNIDTDKHAYHLVRAFIKFTRELGIKTIAEHVSTEAIFETCKELGIDEFQGYFFGEPTEYIERWHKFYHGVGKGK